MALQPASTVIPDRVYKQTVVRISCIDQRKPCGSSIVAAWLFFRRSRYDQRLNNRPTALARRTTPRYCTCTQYQGVFMSPPLPPRGRGTATNPHNRFAPNRSVAEDDGWYQEVPETQNTEVLIETAKTIITH